MHYEYYSILYSRIRKIYNRRNSQFYEFSLPLPGIFGRETSVRLFSNIRFTLDNLVKLTRRAGSVSPLQKLHTDCSNQLKIFPGFTFPVTLTSNLLKIVLGETFVNSLSPEQLQMTCLDFRQKPGTEKY